MWFLDNLKIGVKLPLLTVLIGVIAIATAEIIATTHSRATILMAGQDRLAAVAEGRAAELRRAFDAILADIEAQTGDAVTLEAARAFVNSWRLEGEGDGAAIVDADVTANPNPTPERHRLMQSSDAMSYSLVHRRYHTFFDKHRAARGYGDVYIVSRDGRVVYSAAKGNEFGANLTGGPMKDGPLGRSFLAASDPASVSPGFSGFAGSDSAEQVAIFAAPVRSPLGTLEAVLMIRYPARALAEILGRRSGLGRAGQVILHDAAGATVAAGVLDVPGSSALYADDPSSRGESRMVAAEAPFEVAGQRFSVVARQPLFEILAPASVLEQRMLTDGVIALSIITILGLMVARSMSVPLTRVRLAMASVARHDYESEIPDRARHDEIGSIARQLDRFRASLVEAEGHARENAFKSAAFEASSAAMMLADAQMTIIHVNARLVALMREHRIAIDRLVSDFRPEGLAGRPLVSVFPGADAARKSLAGCDRVASELRLGQSYLRVEIGAVTDDKAVIGYVLEWSDVTADHVNRVVLGSIDRHLPIASFAIDGRLIQSNPLFEAWTPTGSTEMCAGWDDLIGAAEHMGSGVSWPEVTSEGRDGSIFDFCNRSGRPMRATMNAVRDRSGRLQRYVLIAIEAAARPATVRRSQTAETVRLAR